MNKKIRWEQRFQNLKKAHFQLHKGVKMAAPNELEEQGIIKSFEFTFELAWKTLKDFMEAKGSSVSFPRDVIKEAFQQNLISDGEIWLKMLENRNLLSHTYDEKKANEALLLIRSAYEPAIEKLVVLLTKEKNR